MKGRVYMRKGKRYLVAVVMIVCMICLVISGCSSNANQAGDNGNADQPKAKPSREEVIAGIDAVIEELNSGEITEKEAVTKIKDTIPKLDNYPKRPIEIIIGWGPGGGSDLAIRNAGREAEKFLDVPLV